MAGPDIKILEDFLLESKHLVENMFEVLNKCEGNFSQVKSLEKFGMYADRIMGAAKTLGASPGPASTSLNRFGDYAGICKIVAYKAALIADNHQFYEICVALLQDGTEVLNAMISALRTGNMEIKQMVSQTFIDRLKWISSQFGHNYSSKVDIHRGQDTRLNQESIDDLIKKLGF